MHAGVGRPSEHDFKPGPGGLVAARIACCAWATGVMAKKIVTAQTTLIGVSLTNRPSSLLSPAVTSTLSQTTHATQPSRPMVPWYENG